MNELFQNAKDVPKWTNEQEMLVHTKLYNTMSNEPK